MAKVIMIQGTMSNAGKSLVAAGLCRVLRQDGYKVCPFKSQNMALNSYITKEGLEMGRAQVMQAEACGIEPSVRMNPILLKPNSDVGSQVIVNGEVIGNMNAKDYYAEKKRFIPDIIKAYHSLTEEYDIIVIEGAGSPAEINLKDNDLVNMGMAKLVDAPVLLVGDIDRGGVFAQLYGTVKLLEEDEQARIKGLIINKFRGDASILDSGLEAITKLTGIPVVGVLPYTKLDIDDEDSLSECFVKNDEHKVVDIAVIRFPRLSNFTDFAVFEQRKEVGVRYVETVSALGEPDMIILPGTKSTISDLLWMRQNGLEAAVNRAAERGVIIFGICGGYQMLGKELTDETGVEGGGCERGIGLLPVKTIFQTQKHRKQTEGVFDKVQGVLESLSGVAFHGYEIHHGKTVYDEGAVPLLELTNANGEGGGEGAQQGNVYGTYIHGIFDDEAVAAGVLKTLLMKKGYDPKQLHVMDRTAYKETQYDLLADMVRNSMDMEAVYHILGIE